MDLPYVPYGQDDRIEKYETYEALREGRHQEVFKRYIDQVGSVYKRDEKMGMPSLFYTVNLPKEICRISADLLFDEKPIIKTQNNDEFIQAVIEERKFWQKVYENADYGSAKGDAVFRIRVKDNELYIDPVNPALYHAVYDTGNISNEPTAHEIWNPVEIESYGKAYLVEKYTPGLIEYRLVVKKDGDEMELDISAYFPKFAEPIETGLNEDDHLIIHIKNSGIPTDYWGVSDFAGIEDLLYAVNNRFSRIESILDKHSSPVLTGPPGSLIDKNGKMKRNVDVVEYFSNESGEIKYVAWDAQMQYAFDSLNQSIDMVLTLANISPALAGRKDQTGMAESGRALKMRLIRSLAMKHRKELYWGRALKQMFWTMQKWSAVSGYTVAGIRSNDPEMPTIRFQDGVINDPIEKIEIVERKLASGLISHLEAIQEIDDVEEEVAQARIERMKEEKQQRSILFDPTATSVEEDE